MINKIKILMYDNKNYILEEIIKVYLNKKFLNSMILDTRRKKTSIY